MINIYIYNRNVKVHRCISDYQYQLVQLVVRWIGSNEKRRPLSFACNWFICSGRHIQSENWWFSTGLMAKYHFSRFPCSFVWSISSIHKISTRNDKMAATIIFIYTITSFILYRTLSNENGSPVLISIDFPLLILIWKDLFIFYFFLWYNLNCFHIEVSHNIYWYL